MTGQVVVTGATGTLGKAIVSAAQSAGLPVRQAVREATKARGTAEAVRFDYADAATISPALEGSTALVLLAPPLDANAPALLSPVISAAKVAKVKQIVLISAFGVNHKEDAPLRVVEHRVIDSGVPYTILRPNFFMENFSEGPQAGSLHDQNAIFLAAGDGKTSFISVKDVAAVVVGVLQRTAAGEEIDLTGPEALDHTELAKIISEAAGHTVRYHSLSEEEMLGGARSHGVPEPMVVYLGMLYGVVRAGYAAGIATFPEDLAGREATTFQAFAKEANWNGVSR